MKFTYFVLPVAETAVPLARHRKKCLAEGSTLSALRSASRAAVVGPTAFSGHPLAPRPYSLPGDSCVVPFRVVSYNP